MAGKKKLTQEEEIKLLKEQIKALTKRLPPKPNHRPYLFNEEDMKQVEKLCWLPAITEAQIADIMGVSVDTLCKAIKRKHGMTYAEYKAQKTGNFKATLASWQVETARKGNCTMQIFLGKNYLGQSDKQETTLSSNSESPPKLVIEMCDVQDG